VKPFALSRRTLHRLGFGAIGVAAVVVGACHAPSTAGRGHDAGIKAASAARASASPPASDSASPAGVRKSPLSRAELPTTSGEIAVSNLEGWVVDGEKKLAKHPNDVQTLLSLVEVLTARGQYVGTVGDYFRALELAEKLVTLAPKDPRAYLARAKAHGTLHRFDDSLADLAKAAELGAKAEGIDESKASILQARGNFDEALAMRHLASQRRPSLSSLGSEATVLAAMGRTEDAERLFTEAQYHYNDVAPFPVAWLWFQQALMWENAGSPHRARELLKAAVDRLPVYAQAISHLAALEPRTEAIALLDPVVQRTDDPEYPGELSVFVRDAGDVARADALLATAKKGYVALILRAPTAFADHAARFWLGPGQDPARALSLAEANVALRPTPQAKALVAEAQIAVRATAHDR
jgi:tetratricopeptide (TPR) repeat protein